MGMATQVVRTVLVASIGVVMFTEARQNYKPEGRPRPVEPSVPLPNPRQQKKAMKWDNGQPNSKKQGRATNPTRAALKGKGKGLAPYQPR